MFAPKLAKAQTKAAEHPTSKTTSQRSILAGHRLGHDQAKHMLFLQRTIGNQATLRLLAQQTPRPAARDPGGDYQQGGATENTVGASWDFSKIPLFSSDRASRSRGSSQQPGIIQRKLVVGQANDPLEHEGDRVAEQVVQMSTPPLTTITAPPQISRKCSTCEDEDKKALQTKSAGPERPIAGVPSIVHEVLRSPGQPLEPAMRTFMEARSGHDFGRVRVHMDSRANASASAVAARAYTVGHHVVFGEGQFAPGTAEGRRLIAHELMHVMQQRESTVGLSPKLTIAPPGDAFEQEADRFADAVAGGTPNILDTQLPVVVAFSSHPSAAFTLQRQSCNPADDKIKTGALPTQLPAIECAPTPATLQQVRAVPGVPPTILGVTESGFVTDQIQFEELKASKCKAQVLHAAEPKVNFSIYVKEGDFADGTEQTPTTPPSRPCAGKVVARTLRITAEGAKKLRQGEAEHCEDAKLAFALSWGKYNQASKDLEGEYCAAGIKVSGSESICDKEFAKRFTDRTGVDWAKRQQVAKCLLDKSDLRDSNHWHDVVPVDLFYAKDCSAVTYIYGSGSAPEIGKHPPAEIVKGCGEK